MNNHLASILSLSMALLLQACGSEGGSSQKSGMVVDTEAPVVVNVSPSNGAQGADLRPVIQITFSEDIEPASVSNSIMVKHGDQVISGSITASGNTVTFIPQSPLPLSTIFQIEVAPQVADLSGNSLASPFVSMFSTRGRIWHAAEIVTDRGSITGSYEAAMDCAGNVIAVVEENYFDIPVIQYSPDHGWGDAKTLEGTRSTARSPSVAVNCAGAAIVVWAQTSGNEGTQTQIWASRYSPQSGWATPQIIGTNTVVQLPRVAIDGDGNALVVWEASTWDFGYEVWGTRYINGDGWVAQTQLSSNAYSARVAINSAGSLFAVWSQYDFDLGRMVITARQYVPNVGWEAPLRISENGAVGAGSSEFPDIAIDEQGNATAVWTEYGDAQVGRAWTNRFVAGQGWQGANPLDQSPSIKGRVRIAMNGLGQAAAVWDDEDSGSWRVWANRYVVGEGWVGAELLESNTLYWSAPDIAIDDQGNAFAAWMKGNGDQGVWISHFRAEAGWEELMPMNEALSASWAVAVVANPRGEAAVFWHDYAAPWLWVQRFD